MPYNIESVVRPLVVEHNITILIYNNLIYNCLDTGDDQREYSYLKMAKLALLEKTPKLWQCRRCHELTCINSPSLTFSLICLEIIGTGGYMRNVSMMHLSMYFICNVSWNVTGLSESPNIEYSSSTTFCWNENVHKLTQETSI